MKQLLELYNDILVNGETRQDRTRVGTLSVFGSTLRFDLREGFPAVTTKKLAWKSVVSELLWFLEGSSNVHRLAEIKNDNRTYSILNDKEKRTIWTDNYNKQGRELGYVDGELGPIYGYQWLYKDQLKNAIDLIINNPSSRRILVNAWNVNDLDKMALPPCHYCYQFYVSEQYLSLMFNMRSCDVFLGLPFNIASYALLLSIVASICNKVPKELICNLGDTHIYLNHVVQVKEQLKREPYKLPKLKLPTIKDYKDLKLIKCSDIKLEDYVHHGIIRGDMAV